jgi:hypothetical protein
MAGTGEWQALENGGREKKGLILAPVKYVERHRYLRDLYGKKIAEINEQRLF